MHDFLGTFNKSQFDRLVAFARERLALVDARVRHLLVEQQRVGTLLFVYDSAGRPTSYTTGSGGGVTTYIGKLMVAYEVLGGDPFYHLQVRSKSDPVYLPMGSEDAPTKILSNGEPLPGKGRSDGESANAVRSIREWLHDDLNRLERLERKIRRAVDYSDQLADEVAMLRTIKGSVDVDASLENLVVAVQQLISNPAYRAIADDKGRDPFGKLTYAPFSSYDAGGDRASSPGVSVQRSADGYVVVGEK